MEKTIDYKYLKFITYLQIIGIILVVLGHSFNQYPDGEGGQSQWYINLLRNVRMPLFIFVSGYLMYYTSFTEGRKGRTWLDFTKNKIKRLLLPYFTLSLVTFIPKASLSSSGQDPIEMSFAGFFRSLVHQDCLVMPYFWFIQMSFTLLVVTYGILIISKRIKIRIEVAIFSLLLFFIVMQFSNNDFTHIFSIHETLNMGSYFILGVLYCRYSQNMDKSLRLSNIYTAISSVAIWVALYFSFKGTIVTDISSIFGIISFVSFCHILDDRDIRVLDHLQGANYIIFLLSWYVNIATQQVLAHFVTLPWWVHTILSLVGGIYIPWFGLRYLERHSDSRWVRVTAFLLGQKLKRPNQTSLTLQETVK